MRLRRGRAKDGPQESSSPRRDLDLAAVLGIALQELGDDLSASERAMFVQMRGELLGGPTPRPHLQVMALKALASRAAETDRSELVVRLFEVGEDLDPSDAGFPYDMGNHLSRLGRTHEAMAAYSRALAIDPGMGWARYNRGRLLFDTGRVDEGIDDFLAAAHADIQLDGFHDSVTRRVVRERGFRWFLDLVSEGSLPEPQREGFLVALIRAVRDAGSYGGWFVEPPIEIKTDEPTYLMVLVTLADILRDSPFPWAGGLHLSRTRESYTSVVLTEREIADHLWYRPLAWGAGGPHPDRVEHLGILEALIAFAADRGPEAAWAAHYVLGAIALSTLLGGRPDWPTTVLRFAVPLLLGEDGMLIPTLEGSTSVAAWVAAREGEPDPGESDRGRVAAFAARHFRAAADGLRTLVLAPEGPRPAEAWLIGDDDQPLMKDGMWVTGSPAAERAHDVWSWMEPVFREWVTTAVLSAQTAEYLAATGRARQINSVTATELWGKLESERWRASRQTIVSFHDGQPTPAGVVESLGDGGVLVDYYVHEVVEDTVVRLAVGAGGTDVRELPVDTMAGDLAVLLQAHRPGDMPPEGLAGRVDELLMGGLEDVLAGADLLVVVPFGYLRNLPFHALATVQDAVRQGGLGRIAYLPSASTIVRADPNVRPERHDRCLFVGFDALGDIDIDGELDILRRAFSDVTVLRGDDARVDRVLAALADHDVAHFACHGEVDPRVRAGYLELADRRLSPWDLLSGAPVPSTVVLNACLTSTTEIFEPTSDEAFGLHAAFLAAGSRRVVGGLWEVNEWSAAHFAAAFYERWPAETTAAAAVVQAQQGLRAQTSDPFLWAPHALFGDWGS